MVNWEDDPDANHDYGNTFFSYGKSKIVTASVFFPAYLNFRIGNQFDLYLQEDLLTCTFMENIKENSKLMMIKKKY